MEGGKQRNNVGPASAGSGRSVEDEPRARVGGPPSGGRRRLGAGRQGVRSAELRVGVLQPGKGPRQTRSQRAGQRVNEGPGRPGPLRGQTPAALVPTHASTCPGGCPSVRARSSVGEQGQGAVTRQRVRFPFASCRRWAPGRPRWAQRLGAACGPPASAFPGLILVWLPRAPRLRNAAHPRHGAGAAAVVSQRGFASGRVLLSPQRAVVLAEPSVCL